MNRAYAALTVKAVEEDKRVIRGWATTPTPDRVGDIVMPLGVKFKNPMPLLHQHNAGEPVGTVRFDKPTEEGITFEAKFPRIDEPPSLKERIETAWAEVKAGLVRAVSIGFRPIDENFEIMKNGGLRFLETEVLELSLVTIPANQDAKIISFKQFDVGLPADDEALQEFVQYHRTHSPIGRLLAAEAIKTIPPAALGKKAVRLLPPGASGLHKPNPKLRIITR